ncbi:ribonuclease [Novosphingobium sp. TH158]|uniref:ribonuclease n=1 Tax=Novosphingobium sp. TH158 TaxID=2067455 RepID=UPI000C7E1D14|nr:ribonuclease [Novosphingobium sp. TH158]PLK26050.1 ribonuclease [Novosphingobium sp. TH158]
MSSAEPKDGWLVEEGIAEHRALLLRSGTVVAAQIEWPGRLLAGEIAEARLVSKSAGATRGTALFPGGEEALVDRLPPAAKEGALIRLEVVRPALSETGRFKLARARPTNEAVCPAPKLARRLSARVVRAFEPGLWEEVWSEAWEGRFDFDGGSLIISPTPAMTVVDIDGSLPIPLLARAAAKALCAAIPRFNLGGSLAADFPTLERKEDRKAVDALIVDGLQGWPHERTAMNGFGLVQIVSRLAAPSLIGLLANDRAGSAARALLRQAERITDPGQLMLTCNPSVRAAIRQDWIDELARRSGKVIQWSMDPGLALEGGFAQAVPS